MKKITLLAFFAIFITSYGQNYKDLIKKGDSCYKAKEYKISRDYFEKAFKIEHANPSHLYNGACAAALANDNSKAFDWLNLSVQNGYVNRTHLKIDSDLTSLHSKNEWKELIIKLEKKMEIMEVNYDKPLQKELLSIYEEDQGMRIKFMSVYNNPNPDRKKIDSIGKILNYKDSLNLIKVTKILDTKGWVGKDVVGEEANKTLFLVIQHADLQTQQKYLPMMQEAVKKGNASGANLALLEDRVALRQGKKQIYGSQIGKDKETNKYYVSILEDPDNVDKRRAEIGLQPMADYVSKWQIKWDVEQYKKDLPEIEKMSKPKK
ncbi:DUF6624 domain-containing protein [Flavobacterium maritimum]|uniref:DUF6624 domain-containing protein n=1 Tax=Flavobacterium maritimum TaxID=3149042 RepID=UPI0032B4FC76